MRKIRNFHITINNGFKLMVAKCEDFTFWELGTQGPLSKATWERIPPIPDPLPEEIKDIDLDPENSDNYENPSIGHKRETI